MSFFTWLLHALLFDLDGVIVGMFPAAVTFICGFLLSVVRTQSRDAMLAIDALAIVISLVLLGKMRPPATVKSEGLTSYRA